jgi:hypothetical protein
MAGQKPPHTYTYYQQNTKSLVAISPSKNAQQRDEERGNDEFQTIVFPLALITAATTEPEWLPEPLSCNKIHETQGGD